MRRRYLLTMLSVCLLDAAMMLVYALVANSYAFWKQSLVQNVLLFGVVNVLAAVWLYQPIHRFTQHGETPPAELKNAATRRLENLPIRSALWIFALSVVYTIVLFSSGEFTPAKHLLERIPASVRIASLIWFSLVFAVYFGFFIYFAVSDVAEELRIHFFKQQKLFIEPQRKRYARKLLWILAVLVIVPNVHLALDVTLFRDIRLAQGFSLLQTVIIDLMAAAVVFLTVIVFATRSLNRPVENLTFAMQRVSEGDLGHRVPVTADDELGVMTHSFNQMTTRLEEQAIVRDSFGKYVPEAIASAIVAGQRDIAPRQTLATILYADISGFTAIAEQQTPLQVVNMLNEYFTTILKPIEEHKGVVNQFQGDAILVTFNTPVADPDHADNAINAASKVLIAVKENQFAGVSLNVRIGISTGTVVAGNIGSDGRFSYTVHGDAVNLAAKLEQLNKQYSTSLLISVETFKRLSRPEQFEKIGELKLGGKSETDTVYGLANN